MTCVRFIAIDSTKSDKVVCVWFGFRFVWSRFSEQTTRFWRGASSEYTVLLVPAWFPLVYLCFGISRVVVFKCLCSTLVLPFGVLLFFLTFPNVRMKTGVALWWEPNREARAPGLLANKSLHNGRCDWQRPDNACLSTTLCTGVCCAWKGKDQQRSGSAGNKQNNIAVEQSEATFEICPSMIVFSTVCAENRCLAGPTVLWRRLEPTFKIPTSSMANWAPRALPSIARQGENKSLSISKRPVICWFKSCETLSASAFCPPEVSDFYSLFTRTACRDGGLVSSVFQARSCFKHANILSVIKRFSCWLCKIAGQFLFLGQGVGAINTWSRRWFSRKFCPGTS